MAITVASVRRGQLHAGVVYKRENEPARMLHLADHLELCDEPAADVAASHFYVWSPLVLPKRRAEAVVALCMRIAERHPDIPYGVRYNGGSFTVDGVPALGPNAVGLTCATFVLAVVREAGLPLLHYESWPVRIDDHQWHANMVAYLRTRQVYRPDIVNEEYLAQFEAEQGCARYRPEEVAAAVPLVPHPVEYERVRPHSAALYASLMLGVALSSAKLV